MRILWVCNILPPILGEKLGLPGSVKEGWISGILEQLIQEPEVETLGVCFPTNGPAGHMGTKLQVGEKEVCLYDFTEDTIHPECYETGLEQRFAEIFDHFSPYVLHIFGTEYGHTLAALKAFGKPEKSLVGLQGIISLCAKAYMADLPKEIQQKRTFRDRLKKDSLLEQQEKFRIRGEREKESIALTGHVTGRTQFDKDAALQINPRVQYHPMNETMRSCFYTGNWSLESCKKHSIFFSQADYPLKGFHYLLQALPKILQQFPDTTVTVAGNSLVQFHTIKEKLKISAYGAYLRKVMQENRLEEKIRFLGKLEAEQMKQAYLNCHTFVCASSLENSPNSVAEAMLLGVPVVAPIVGGIPSMVETEKEGILYAPGNTEALAEAIIRLWQQDELAQNLGAKGQIKAKKAHNGANNYSKLLAMYQEIGL